MTLPPSLGVTPALWIAFAIGIAFGFALERAGLGSARKLSAQFQLTDLTVFKVMFTAILTAMLGVFFLGQLGVVDVGRLRVPATFLVPQAVGGLLFGAGLLVAGLCPGTACVSAATGRGDGAAAAIGIFAGVVGASLAVPAFAGFYGSTARGPLTLPALLGVPPGTVVAAIVTIALLGFWAAERLEARRRTRRACEESESFWR